MTPVSSPKSTNSWQSGCRKCGNKEHDTDKCESKYYLCFNCQESGHFIAECPHPRGIRSICPQCGRIGHFLYKCPEVQCRRCGKFGHLTSLCGAQSSSSTFNANGSGGEQTRDGGTNTHASGKPETQNPPRASTPPKPNPKPKTNQSAESAFNNTKRSDSNINASAESRKVNAERFREKGDSASRDGDHEAAVQCYTRAIGYFSKEPVYYAKRGRSYLELRRFEEALVDLHHVDLKPSPEIMNQLARCYHCLGSPDKALGALEKIENIELGNKNIRDLKSRVLKQQKHLQDFADNRRQKNFKEAQRSMKICVDLLLEARGIIPVAWQCWDIEFCVINSDWKDAHNKAW